MDLNAIIIVILLSGGFFSFIIWAAFHSRKNNSEKLPAEVNFSEVRKRGKQYLEK